eukprot:Skav207802  [mRNA]  locus=scaffold381:23573:27208:+ [translate_table: standard]
MTSSSNAQRVPSRYVTCRKCWKVNPVGAVKLWSIKCQVLGERAVAAQGRYWRSLSKKQQDALAKAWGVSVSQVKGFFPKGPKKAKKSARLNPLSGVRIGEASHPGPRQRAGRKLASLAKLWTCNTGGAPKAWKLLPFFTTEKPDIVFLQEVGFKPNEWKAFHAHAQKIGYHGFFTGASSQKPGGEAAVLIRKCFPCRPAWNYSSTGGAAQLVWMGGYLVGSIYLAPNPDSMQVCEEVTQAMHTIGSQCGWLVGGDFNAETDENPFKHTLADLQVGCWDPGVPTRWSGNRCIDYFLSNRVASHTQVLDHEIADHCIVQTQVQFRLPTVETWTQCPVVRLPSLKQMNCTEEAWQSHVSSFWTHNPQDAAGAPDVNTAWQHLSQELFSSLTKAVAALKPDVLAQIPRGMLRKGKPTAASFQPDSNAVRVAAGAQASCKEIRLSRQLGRLREISRLVGHNQRIPQCLWDKLARSPYYDPQISVHHNIIKTQNLLNQCHELRQRTNLTLWKEKMQDDKCAFAWLRKDPQILTHAVKLHQGDVAASSISEALSKIKDFWKPIWEREEPDWNRAWQDITEQLGGPVNSETWLHLRGEDLAQAAKQTKGTAPGLDQWTKDELLLLSPTMWDSVADFVKNCELQGQIPDQWKEIRQMHLSKGKASDLVGDLRPISVTSLWWRTVQRARFQHEQTQKWINQTMPHYVYGGVPGKGTIDAVAPLLKADASHWWIGSLDYQKAFDRVQPREVCSLFKYLGMPPMVADLMLSCWSDQRRYLQYLNQFDPSVTKVSSSLLQGDPFSMLGMAVIMLPAAAEVAQTVPAVTQVLYADDRTLAAPSVDTLLESIRIWHRWGTRLGLADNVEKTQFYHPTKKGRADLAAADIPDKQIVDDLKVLGFCFQGVQARQATATENTRLQKAQVQALRVACLPGSLHRKVRSGQYTVPAKAGYGWLCRNPSLQDAKPLEAACRKLMQKQRQAAPDLFKLVKGHFWDLKFLATQTQVATLVRFAHKSQQAMPPQLLSKAGWPRAVNQGLNNLGWTKLRGWVWRHEGLNLSLALSGAQARQKSVSEACHALRESWRHTRFQSFLGTARRDAAQLQNVAYSESRVHCLRTYHHNKHSIAVVTGAFISPAAFQKMNTSDTADSVVTNFPGCPFCGCHAEQATLDHVVWECPSNGRPAEATPCDDLEKRLGWPSQTSDACLRWMASVRQVVLDARHDRM